VNNPLRMIPRAVLATAIFAGLFFVASAYAEVLGFRGLKDNLASSTRRLKPSPVRRESAASASPLRSVP